MRPEKDQAGEEAVPILPVQNSLRPSRYYGGFVAPWPSQPKILIESPMAWVHHLLCSVDEESSRSRWRTRTRILHNLLVFSGRAANRKLRPGWASGGRGKRGRIEGEEGGEGVCPGMTQQCPAQKVASLYLRKRSHMEHPGSLWRDGIGPHLQSPQQHHQDPDCVASSQPPSHMSKVGLPMGCLVLGFRKYWKSETTLDNR